jgi:diaminohydroxyphosphoribosylaminopyrimidine deaminase/5-amino-6-(5-phosphoribosylamino)uracil reductase
LDNSLRLPKEHKLVATAKEIPTIIFTSNVDPCDTVPMTDAGVEVVPVTGGPRNLDEVLQELYRRDIQSVLVEGGSEVAGAFIDAKLVDKITFIIAPIIVGGKVAPVAIGGKGVTCLSDSCRLNDVSISQLGADIEIIGYPSFN